MKKIALITLLLASLNIWAQQGQNPESVVQKQVEAYNSRDLEAFLSFYADDVKIYTFPNRLDVDGKAAMRESYAPFFKAATLLHCKIVKRIVRKNTVIDEELIKYNDSEFGGVAIYEVQNDKIIRVTFVE
ncbi:MAG: nuclear transport factor 2 family protein [Flavobacterium sp.]|uniref:nuclear transport factor 2 family protein n=1 Tax=Flavobacterium sp. TaxID=239 RepID=UPI00391D1BA8